jgi:hypothetical protein
LKVYIGKELRVMISVRGTGDWKAGEGDLIILFSFEYF